MAISQTINPLAKGILIPKVRTITSGSQTLSISDHIVFLSGTFDTRLPLAASCKGKVWFIQVVSSSACTLTPQTGEYINEMSMLSLMDGTGIVVWSNGTMFFSTVQYFA